MVIGSLTEQEIVFFLKYIKPGFTQFVNPGNVREVSKVIIEKSIEVNFGHLS